VGVAIGIQLNSAWSYSQILLFFKPTKNYFEAGCIFFEYLKHAAGQLLNCQSIIQINYF
jgi:hypothetical protein